VERKEKIFAAGFAAEKDILMEPAIHAGFLRFLLALGADGGYSAGGSTPHPGAAKFSSIKINFKEIQYRWLSQ